MQKKKYNNYINDLNNDNKENNYIKENYVKGQHKPINKDQLAIIFKQMEKVICKIQFIRKNKKNEDENATGTGFFCKIQKSDEFKYIPVLITNNHVLNENDILKGKSIKFTLNDDKISHQIIIDEKRICYTNKTLDITIIEIKKSDNIDLKICLEIDDNIYENNPNDFYKDKSIYLLHYEHGDISEVSYGVIENIDEEDNINHSCSTEKGSSGAPIINSLNNKVIGLHKGHEKGRNCNLGSFIKKPIEDFFNVYKNENNKEDNDELNNDDLNNDDLNNDDINNDDINNNKLNKEIEMFLESTLKIYQTIFKNKEPPLYLKKMKDFIILEDWEKALELGISNRDRFSVKRILLFLNEKPRNNILIDIIKKFPDLNKILIKEFKDDGKEYELKKYLGKTGNYEELFFLSIEKFFGSKRIHDREEYLNEARMCLENIKEYNKYELYKVYLNDLRSSLTFKDNLLKKGIIPKNEITSFDISIYDCYNCYGITEKNYYLKEENKLILSQKTLSYLWFKNLIKKEQTELLEEIISTYGFEKLQITPLSIAKLLYEFQFNDLSVQFLKKEKSPNNFEEKIELLKKLERYDVIIEIIMNDKNVSK